jgi:hypothetical protein
MELYPIKDRLGYAELLSAARRSLMRPRTSSWQLGSGIVEGYELIQVRKGGWFVVHYSYVVNGDWFSGEWHRFVVEGFFSTLEDKCDAIVQRLPRGTRISIRIDPNNHARSVAEL